MPLLNVTTLTGIFCWALCSVTFAGSWQPPSTYKRVSDNERHQVTVTAPIEASKTKSQIIVAKKLAGSWSKTWSQNAVNPVVPLKAFLTDDGSRVITLGNWGGRENSDDSLVVYSHNRVLARYTVSDLAGVEARVPMTSVGSGWLIGSHTFLDEQLGFALWLDFAERWVLVDLKNGTLRTLTPKLIKQCEEIARAHLLARIEADEATFTDYQLLSRFLRPEDAILFEPLLNHPYQHLSCGARHQNNKILRTMDSSNTSPRTTTETWQRLRSTHSQKIKPTPTFRLAARRTTNGSVHCSSWRIFPGSQPKKTASSSSG